VKGTKAIRQIMGTLCLSSQDGLKRQTLFFNLSTEEVLPKGRGQGVGKRRIYNQGHTLRRERKGRREYLIAALGSYFTLYWCDRGGGIKEERGWGLVPLEGSKTREKLCVEK